MLTLKIELDTDPLNPRTDMETSSTMICFHKKYNLGNETELKQVDFSSWDEIKKKIKAVVILPIYMLDHSGITIKTTPFDCHWDSGQIGFIFMTKAQVRQINPLIKNITEKVRKQAREWLEADIVAYDQHLTGEIYQFTIEDETGNIIDSCGGFYGYDQAESEGKNMLEYHTLRLSEL